MHKQEIHYQSQVQKVRLQIYTCILTNISKRAQKITDAKNTTGFTVFSFEEKGVITDVCCNTHVRWLLILLDGLTTNQTTSTLIIISVLK